MPCIGWKVDSVKNEVEWDQAIGYLKDKYNLRPLASGIEINENGSFIKLTFSARNKDLSREAQLTLWLYALDYIPADVIEESDKMFWHGEEGWY